MLYQEIPKQKDTSVDVLGERPLSPERVDVPDNALEVLDGHRDAEVGEFVDTNGVVLDTMNQTTQLHHAIGNDDAESSHPVVSEKPSPPPQESSGWGGLSTGEKISVGLTGVGALAVGYGLYRGVRGLWNWAFGDDEKDTQDDDEKKDKEEGGFFSSLWGGVKKVAVVGGLILGGGYIARQLDIGLPSWLSWSSLTGLLGSGQDLLDDQKKKYEEQIAEMQKRIDDAKVKITTLTGQAHQQAQEAIDSMQKQIDAMKQRLQLPFMPTIPDVPDNLGAVLDGLTDMTTIAGLTIPAGMVIREYSGKVYQKDSTTGKRKELTQMTIGGQSYTLTHTESGGRKAEAVVSDEEKKKTEDEVAHKAKEKVDELLLVQKDKQKKVWEERLGESIDQEKRDTARDRWVSKNKQKFVEIGAIKDEGGNLVDTGFDIMTMPARMIFSFWMSLYNEGIVSIEDFAMVPVSEGAETVIEFGAGVPSLFGHAWKFVCGKVSLADIADEIEEGGESLSPETRMNLWASLYRHGGLLKSVMGGIGTVTGGMMTALIDGGSSRLSTLDGLLSGWTQTMNKQGDILGRLEQTLVKASITKPMMADYAKALKILNQNTIMIDALNRKEIKTLSQLKDFLTSKGHGSLFDDFVAKLADRSDAVSKSRYDGASKTVKLDTKITDIKGLLGDVCFQRVREGLTDINDHASSMKGRFSKTFSKLNPRHYSTQRAYHVQIIDNINALAKSQERLLQKDKARNAITNIINRGRQGESLKNLINANGQIKLHLQSVDDAKDFFANIKTISLHFPEMFGMIAKSLPLVFVGGEVMDAITGGKPAGKAIVDGLMSLIPFVGPIQLLQSSANVGPDMDLSKVDRAGATFSLGLLGYDGFRLAKNISKAQLFKPGVRSGVTEFAKLMVEPARDVADIFRKVVVDIPMTTYKMTKDGVRIITKPGGRSSFLREGGTFLKGSAKRLGVAAVVGGLIYGGYKRRQYDSNLSEEEKKQLEALHDDPIKLNDTIKAGRKEMTDDEKKIAVGLSCSESLGLDSDQLTINQTTTGRRILSSVLIDKSQLLSARDRINDALASRGETTQATITYSREGVATILAQLRTDLKDPDTSQEASDLVLIDHLNALGYSYKDCQEIFGLTMPAMA